MAGPRTWTIRALLIGVVIPVAAGWVFANRTETPEPLTIESAVAQVRQTTTPVLSSDEDLDAPAEQGGRSLRTDTSLYGDSPTGTISPRPERVVGSRQRRGSASAAHADDPTTPTSTDKPLETPAAGNQAGSLTGSQVDVDPKPSDSGLSPLAAANPPTGGAEFSDAALPGVGQPGAGQPRVSQPGEPSGSFATASQPTPSGTPSSTSSSIESPNRPPTQTSEATRVLGSPQNAAATTTAQPLRPLGALSGTWTVQASPSSHATYRVDVELAGIGPTTVFGTSSGVTGSADIAGTMVSAARFEVDMAGLQSISPARDRALRTVALETDRYPSAIFELTGPIDFGSVPNLNKPFEEEALGLLTLHGTTRPIDIPLTAQRVENVIVLVASQQIALTDHGITVPVVDDVIAKVGIATFELQLVLENTER